MNKLSYVVKITLNQLQTFITSKPPRAPTPTKVFSDTDFILCFPFTSSDDDGLFRPGNRKLFDKNLLIAGVENQQRQLIFVQLTYQRDESSVLSGFFPLINKKLTALA